MSKEGFGGVGHVIPLVLRVFGTLSCLGVAKYYKTHIL